MSQKKGKRAQNLSNQLGAILIALLVITLSVIGLLDLGIVGQTLTNLLILLFGSFPQVYFVVIIATTLIVLISLDKKIKLRWYHITGLILLWFSFQLFQIVFNGESNTGWSYLTNYFSQIPAIYARTASSQGGISGAFLYTIFSFLFDRLGTTIIAFVFVIAGVILLFNNSLEALIKLIPKNRPKKKPKPIKKQVKQATNIEYKPIDMEEALANQKQTEKKTIFIDSEDVIEATPQPVKKQDFNIKETTSTGDEPENESYQIGSLDILDRVVKTTSSGSNQQSAEVRGQRLLEILKQFDISASLLETHIGPSVTKFVLKLETGVKVNRIMSLQDNLMMELAVKELRIEAPIPGKNAVGVEIPNIEMTPVRLSEVLEAVPVDKKDRKLLIGLGKNLMGEPVFGELNRMPHLLIAGATGSGKSVAVNSMITTLLLRTKPNEVKLLLIDPKKVEFSVFTDVPHLIAPVISDAVEAAKSLRVIVNMMENRYEAFAREGARHISSYNQIVAEFPDKSPMPNIVIIIDELADLMSVAGKEVEGSIQRITQLARAAGIHLVVATQRPSVDVITGVIKANIPSRIAFAVSSGTDSRTILDQTGAENLLGYGDMLYIPIGEPHPQRIQGVYVTDDEVHRVAQYVKSQAKPQYDDAFLNLEGADNNSGFVDIMEDPLYEEVKHFVIIEQKASTSLLQRRFGVGYNRGARLMDALEMEGIVGPQQGSKPRDVYKKIDELEETLES